MEYRKITSFNHSSLSVNVPHSIAAKIGFKKGDYVMVDVEKGAMTVRKAPEMIKRISEAQNK